MNVEVSRQYCQKGSLCRGVNIRENRRSGNARIRGMSQPNLIGEKQTKMAENHRQILEVSYRKSSTALD